jgi:hypothetical protein
MFVSLVPLRLFNPTCGSDWTREDYGNADFIHSVKQQGVNYHRLHPNYFYGVGSAQITVRFTPSVDNKQDQTMQYFTPRLCDIGSDTGYAFSVEL